MTTQQIEYILTLAEKKSFSQAAAALYITQPALSKFIIGIEEQLGAKLFDRSSTPIQLTQAGEIYVEKAKKIQMLKNDLVNEISDLGELKAGTLTIGTTPFRGSCLLPKSIAAFHKKYNGISVHISEVSQTELEKDIISGRLDVAISSTTPNIKIFHYEVLSQEKLYLAVSKDNPINEYIFSKKLTADDIIRGHDYNKAIDLSMFANENFIRLESSELIDSIAVKLCENAGFTPNTILKTAYLETAFSFVLANMGVTFIPDSYIKFGNCENHPYYYSINDDLSYMNIMLISKRNRYLTRAAREYSLILKQLIGIGTWKS